MNQFLGTRQIYFMLKETWLLEYTCKEIAFCKTDIFTEIKFPFVKNTDSKAFNLIIIKLDPAETILTRSRLA